MQPPADVITQQTQRWCVFNTVGQLENIWPHLLPASHSTDLFPPPKSYRCSQWSPAALVLATPASFRYNNLGKSTKAAHMPVNRTFKQPPRATCTAHPGVAQNSIRRLEPYLHNAVGIIWLGVLNVAVKQTWWCNERSTHKKMAPSVNWSSILSSNYSPSHAS